MALMPKPPAAQRKNSLQHLHLGTVKHDPGAADVPKAMGRFMRTDYLPLAGLPKLAPPSPLGNLRPLVLGELVEDALRELPLRGVVPAVVVGAQPTIVLLEFPPEQIHVGRLTCEPVAVLG